MTRTLWGERSRMNQEVYTLRHIIIQNTHANPLLLKVGQADDGNSSSLMSSYCRFVFVVSLTVKFVLYSICVHIWRGNIHPVRRKVRRIGIKTPHKT